MIARLNGEIAALGRDHLIVDVNGVGYLVRASQRMLAEAPKPGASVKLLIDTLVREDAIELFGFLDADEQAWFRLLTTVQGVGAKLALSILSGLPPRQIAEAIAAGDRAVLARADGVGPKLAGRIANELKDKAQALAVPAAGAGAPITLPVGPLADAVSALVNLGYRRADAAQAVERARQRLGPQAGLEALIPAGLRELAP